MSAVAPNTELSKEQDAALDALKGVLTKGYRSAKKAMAAIAVSIVDLRMTFMKDGKPDYRGDTAEYRAAIGRVYEELLSDEDERSSFQQSIRYWISKEFQARVHSGKINLDELASAGIEKPKRKQAAAARKAPAAQGDGASRDGASQDGAVHLDDNGVAMRDGKAMKPKEMRKLIESITNEHLVEVGPVTLLRSITSEVKALHEAVASGEVSAKASVFRGTVKNLLVATQALAESVGVAVAEATPAVAESAAVAEPPAANQDEGDRLTRRRPGRPRGSKNKTTTGKRKGKKSEEASPELQTANIEWPS